VWFDSGISYAAVCESDPRLGFPVDLYLEGSDQHRGWFHTSLLESIATRSCAPYKQVVTHGFIVDKDGYKMSKSLGNVVDPSELIKKSGADILRLWASYEDFSEDISYSEESYVRVTEAYRRIRNTFRFILGNISDFDPSKDFIPYKDLRDIDKWMINKINNLITETNAAYENFEFYKVFHLVHNFCVVELSSLYLDISKDILYANKTNSKARRSIQNVMYKALDTMLKLFAPIIPFTTEEAYESMQQKEKESIHLCKMPEVEIKEVDKDLEEKWAKILATREEVSKALEEARRNKIIGHSLDADVRLSLNEELYKIFSSKDVESESIFIVSNVYIEKADKLNIEVSKSSFNKCARCWQYKEEVGKIKEYEDICQRCKNEIN
jgi:isoleucyl-tRNA synthetase